MAEAHEIPVIQTGGQVAPRALVFAGKAVPLTPAQAKRSRYVHNLKQNHERLKEYLQAIEHFAVVCELSEARIAEIRKAKDSALEELSMRLEEKLRGYDRRIKEGG